MSFILSPLYMPRPMVRLHHLFTAAHMSAGVHCLLQGNHIYTSGATGTNAAVIKGALRADATDLLTVILPQSRSKQPQESQELLQQVRMLLHMFWKGCTMMSQQSMTVCSVFKLYSQCA